MSWEPNKIFQEHCVLPGDVKVPNKIFQEHCVLPGDVKV